MLAERADKSPLRARAASTFTISKQIEEPDSGQPKFMVNTQGSFDASNFRGTSSLGQTSMEDATMDQVQYRQKKKDFKTQTLSQYKEYRMSEVKRNLEEDPSIEHTFDDSHSILRASPPHMITRPISKLKNEEVYESFRNSKQNHSKIKNKQYFVDVNYDYNQHSQTAVVPKGFPKRSSVNFLEQNKERAQLDKFNSIEMATSKIKRKRAKKNSIDEYVCFKKKKSYEESLKMYTNKSYTPERREI